MSTTPSNPDPYELIPTAPAADGIDLFELLTRFVVEWRKLIAFALIPFLIGLAMILRITPLYEASASILPQAGVDSSSVASFFSGRSPGDVFLGLLSSRSVADEVIDHAGLMEAFHVTKQEQARAELGGRSSFSEGRDTMVLIKVRDRDAQLAMRICNAYLEGLQAQREKMQMHEAELHDRFFKQQLAHEAEALSNAEQDLESAQEHTGLVQPEAQTSLGLNAIAEVRGQITALQVRLSALLLGDSDQNPEVKALRAQIGQLQGREAELQSANSGAGAGAAASARQMPELNLEYARRKREVAYHEALYTSISTKYEAAKLEEGNAGAPFVIVDRAIAPEHKAWPPRRTLFLLNLGGSVLISLFGVGLLLLWRSLMCDPRQAARVQQMRQSFRFRR